MENLDENWSDGKMVRNKNRNYSNYRKYTNDEAEKAVLEILEQGASIRMASEKYGIPKSTLNDRIRKWCDENSGKPIQQEVDHFGEAIPVPSRLCILCRCRRSAERRFHRFPDGRRQRKKWLDALQLEEKHITPDSSVCSLHFDQEADFVYKKSSLAITGLKRCLKHNAVPSLFFQGEEDNTSVFFIRKANNIPLNSELNENSTDNDGIEITDENFDGTEETESFVEQQNIQESEEVQETEEIQETIIQETEVVPSTLLKGINKDSINTENTHKAHIKRLEQRVAEAEGKVKQLENLNKKRKRNIYWNRKSNEPMEVLQTAHTKILEKQLEEEEGKVRELENHCKNLCEIVKSQNETISDLESRLELAEQEKIEIQSIKVQEIVTTVAMHNQQSKRIRLSDSDSEIES